MKGSYGNKVKESEKDIIELEFFSTTELVNVLNEIAVYKNEEIKYTKKGEKITVFFSNADGCSKNDTKAGHWARFKLKKRKNEIASIKLDNKTGKIVIVSKEDPAAIMKEYKDIINTIINNWNIVEELWVETDPKKANQLIDTLYSLL